eukprot:UN13632
MFVLGSPSPVYSRKIMMLPCILSVIMAIGCAFGLASYMGYKYSADLLVPCILLLGLGLDDCYILT